MKQILLGLAILLTGTAQLSAQTYLTRTGKIDFNATSKSSPEKIEGKNNEVACILNAATGDIRFQALMNSFKFEKELMQEHFNENYLESDKYPKADFKGTITNIKDVNFSKNGSYNITASGTLTIHGITNKVVVPGTLEVKNNSIELQAKFAAKLQDYHVTIPLIVADKIDKVAIISVECILDKK